jgi:uncharacterized membrane protein/mono/diheme cytochrome c family protein
MIEFFGRFHPVLVHLPIGILFLACVFQVATWKPRFMALQPAIPAMVFWGMVSATGSCISGYFLSLSGDYEGQVVNWHKWMGITVAVVSLLMYTLYRRNTALRTMRVIAILLIVLITITGHLGGSLTHGSDYLTAPLNQPSAKEMPVKPIADIQQAAVYADMVQPLLQARCYSCHGAEKQKGKLRMDLPEHLLKGGENGKLYIAGNAAESELIRRLMLPLSHEDHMPPKEKPQLSKEEIALLHWWISNGADLTKKVNQFTQSAQVKTMLAAFQAGTAGKAEEPAQSTDVPKEEVKAANGKDLARLTNAGVVIMPVGSNTNYLSANFVNAVSLADSVLNGLASVDKQLIWLRMEHPAVNTATLRAIAKCKNLTRLHLANTATDDKGLAELKGLDKLQLLNLSGTRVTKNGLLQLKGLNELTVLYLYKTNVSVADQAELKKAFPKTSIDFGNYTVPTRAEDTTLVEPPKTK